METRAAASSLRVWLARLSFCYDRIELLSSGSSFSDGNKSSGMASSLLLVCQQLLSRPIIATEDWHWQAKLAHRFAMHSEELTLNNYHTRTLGQVYRLVLGARVLRQCFDLASGREDRFCNAAFSIRAVSFAQVMFAVYICGQCLQYSYA